jgi:hypothetical protein
MPIVVEVEDVQWEESNDMVIINLPLNGVKSSKVDIYSNDVFVKVRLSFLYSSS